MGNGATKERIELARKTKMLNLEDDDHSNYEKWGTAVAEKVPDLRSLSFSGNKFSGVVPRSFLTALTFLKVLRMDRNQITSADALCLLPCLEILSLCHNKLTSVAIGVVGLGGSSPLAELHLSHNALVSISPEFFAATPKLKILVLDHNKLSALPDALTKCTLLESVSASHNALEAIPKGPWDGCEDLRQIDVSHNKLTSFPGSLLASTKLFKLDVGGNGLFGLDALKEMPEYAAFERRQRHVVNKGIQGGLVVKLN